MTVAALALWGLLGLVGGGVAYRLADRLLEPAEAGGPGLLTPFAGHRREGTVLAANLGVVSGMGGSPGTLAADAARAKESGATEIRLYHAGLASDGDLASVREALAAR